MHRYLLSVKKAIVDFVLQDPSRPPPEEDLSEDRLQLQVTPKPWAAAVADAKVRLSSHSATLWSINKIFFSV